jgi:hypothetical protein
LNIRLGATPAPPLRKETNNPGWVISLNPCRAQAPEGAKISRSALALIIAVVNMGPSCNLGTIIMAYKAPQISADQFVKEHGKPTVLSFQPDSFRLLKDPSDLREWEAKLKRDLGLSLDIEHITESCTDSGNDCDTD